MISNIQRQGNRLKLFSPPWSSHCYFCKMQSGGKACPDCDKQASLFCICTKAVSYYLHKNVFPRENTSQLDLSCFMTAHTHAARRCQALFLHVCLSLSMYGSMHTCLCMSSSIIYIHTHTLSLQQLYDR